MTPSSWRSVGTRRRRTSPARRTPSRTSTTATSTSSGRPRGAIPRHLVPGLREALRVGSAARQVVPGRHAQRLLQLRRPPRRDRARRQGRLPLGGRAGGRSAHHHLCRPPAGRRPLGERAQELGVGEGHAGRRSTWAWCPSCPRRCSRARGSGAPHTVVFGGFSAESLSARMNDMSARCSSPRTRPGGGGRRAPQADRRRRDGCGAGREALPGAAPHRQRRAMQAGRDVWLRRSRRVATTRRRAPASRWTARTCCS